MSKHFRKALQPDETVIREAGVTPVYYLLLVFVFLFAVIFSIVILSGVTYLMAMPSRLFAAGDPGAASMVATGQLIFRVLLAVVIVLIIGIVAAYAARASQIRYAITNRRLLVRHGIFSNNVGSADLTRIQDVHLRQSLTGRIANYGQLLVETAGTLGALKLVYVSEPHEWLTALYAARASASDTSSAPTQPVAPPPPSW